MARFACRLVLNLQPYEAAPYSDAVYFHICAKFIL